LSSSVDYKAYVQASGDEEKRLTRILQGVENDPGQATEHFLAEHLVKLLRQPLSRELRSLYMAEYVELRSSMRATAVANLNRKDYYDVASQEAIRRRNLLENTLASNQELAKLLLKDDIDGKKTELSEDAEQYVNIKNQIQARVKERSGSPLGDTPTPKDVIRSLVKEKQSVNDRGVSRSPTMER